MNSQNVTDQQTAVLCSRSFMTYGLFVEVALTVYALLKLAPTRTVFIARMVATDYTSKVIDGF